MNYEKMSISVSDLNKYIKEKVSTDEFLNHVLVRGEISNFKHHYTGHMYFTLKDENSLIKCIMFKSYTNNLKFVPKDGMKVIVLGTVSVFERDGVYQIYCQAMQESGMGNLHIAYEKLKEKLELEGLFNKEHKKPIPYMPASIGVLTSKTGSVIKDIINVSTRRNPNVYIKLLPVPVQGEGAAAKIAEAIRLMNDKKLVDVIIIARGGGSLEDLWPFNEEIVARAIYQSELPIISAVGHETDFTIADFVSDLRAPTPSAAAELAVPDIIEVKRNLLNYESKYKILLKRKLELMKLQYQKCMMSRAFKDPKHRINEYYQLLDNILKNIEKDIKNIYNKNKNQAVEVISKLDTLSPLKTLIRGYSITQDGDTIIKSVQQLEKGKIVKLRYIDGETDAQIL